MLSQKEKRIFYDFVSRIRIKFPFARIWAFGSRTRGDATRLSDLDVCVVLETLNDESEVAVMDIARQIGLYYDVVVTTVIYSQEEFDNAPLSDSGLVKYVMGFGIAA